MARVLFSIFSIVFFYLFSAFTRRPRTKRSTTPYHHHRRRRQHLDSLSFVSIRNAREWRRSIRWYSVECRFLSIVWGVFGRSQLSFFTHSAFFFQCSNTCKCHLTLIEIKLKRKRVKNETEINMWTCDFTKKKENFHRWQLVAAS